MAAAEEEDLRASAPELSVVVPAHDEVESIERLVESLVSVLAKFGRSFEILAVDDGSTDGTFAVLERLSRAEPRLRVIRFRKCFGQTPALMAGFDGARGKWVVTIDADLQNDPADIPAMIERAEEGYDIVSGWRRDRKDGLFARKVPSRVANWLIGKVTGIHLHDYGCSLKVYERDVVKNVQLYGELHRFIPAVAASLGVRCVEVPVAHHPRLHGTSKYTGLVKTAGRTFKVLLDLLTVRFLLSYSTRPIHVFGGLGLLAFVLGAGTGAYLSYGKLVHGWALADRPLLLLAVLLVMVGVQLLSLGLVGELVVRTYHETQKKPIYAVRQRLNEPPSSGGRADEGRRGESASP